MRVKSWGVVRASSIFLDATGKTLTGKRSRMYVSECASSGRCGERRLSHMSRRRTAERLCAQNGCEPSTPKRYLEVFWSGATLAAQSRPCLGTWGLEALKNLFRKTRGTWVRQRSVIKIAWKRCCCVDWNAAQHRTRLKYFDFVPSSSCRIQIRKAVQDTAVKTQHVTKP